MTRMWKTESVSIMLSRNSLGRSRRWGISKILEIIIGGGVKMI
jgi:hypothetical protein